MFNLNSLGKYSKFHESVTGTLWDPAHFTQGILNLYTL
jgi:hypothetical protein